MPKLFLSLVILLGVNFSFGQTNDQHWLDSLQSIVVKTNLDEMYYTSGIAKKYIDANLKIGEYHEKLYQQNASPDLKKAMIWYGNIAAISVFPDNESFFLLMAIRNNVCRKLSSIYFSGKGIKADRAKAIELAVKGMGNNKELYQLYSKRFYNQARIILNMQTNKTGNDSVFKLNINPFSLQVISDIQVNDPQFGDIAKRFSSSKKFSKKYMYINVYAAGTVQGDYAAETLMEMLKEYFVKKMHINAHKIIFSSEYDYNSGKMNLVEIKFKTEKENL